MSDVKQGVRDKIDDLVCDFWRIAKDGQTPLRLREAYDEIQALENDLEFIEALEERAFKCALVKVSGSTEQVAEIHWQNYKAGHYD